MIRKNEIAASLLHDFIQEGAIEDSGLAWLIRPRKQSRSGQIATVALLCSVFLLGACHFPGMLQARATASGRTVPNLLLIIADDQSGLWLGAAGDRRGATPHLDALARQGVLFDRTFCNFPLCTSSRQSFITGLLPHASGVTRLETRLPEQALTLGRWLSILGYRTAAIGKMHFNGPSRHGFDIHIDVAQWLAHLQQHPPAGGDQRKEWRPFLDPATVWLNARWRIMACPPPPSNHLLRGPRHRIHEPESRPPLCHDRQLL